MGMGSQGQCLIVSVPLLHRVDDVEEVRELMAEIKAESESASVGGGCVSLAWTHRLCARALVDTLTDMHHKHVHQPSMDEAGEERAIEIRTSNITTVGTMAVPAGPKGCGARGLYSGLSLFPHLSLLW